MNDSVNMIDPSVVAAGLSKTSKNNQILVKEMPHLVPLLTSANMPPADTPVVSTMIPVIPAPRGVKSPEQTQIILEKFNDKIAQHTQVKITNPEVEALLSGKVKDLGAQAASLGDNAVSSVEFMLQMMQLTAPSKQIEAMQKVMNAQEAQVSQQTKNNINNIAKYYKNMEKAAHKGKWAKIFGWVASIATLVIGALVTVINPVAGIAMMTAGAFMLANQIFQETASEHFKNSLGGKILGGVFTWGAAVASVVGAVATGGASAWAMGFAIMSATGSVVGSSIQTAEQNDKSFRDWLSRHPVWGVVINSIGPAMSAVGGLGTAGFGTGTAKAADAVEEVSETSGTMTKLLTVMRQSKYFSPMEIEAETQIFLTRFKMLSTTGRDLSTGTASGINLDASFDTRDAGTAKATSEQVQAELKQLEGYQKALSKTMSSVFDFVNSLQNIVADIMQSQVQSNRETTRFGRV